ncbi:hypothetical protein ACUN9W_05490, partial [Escherichia coli]
MKRLSITVRLTLLFILLLSVAGAGIVWTLYNGLASELKWRDDTTLINRTAQIKQLLIDGVNPDTLPVYFNRMMDVSQDILIIHGDSINKIVNRTNVSNGMLNNIPASETISAAGIYRSIINDTEIDALRINIDEVSPSLTVTVAKLASARHNMLEQYKINSIIICIVAIILCSVLSPLLIRTGLREIKKLSGVTEALNYNDSREPEYGGRIEDVVVERIFFSEDRRTGIGTFSPSDPKSQDIADLTGSLDFSTIAEYGSESDPRAYRFDGELNKANRGMMEFQEMLKCDEKFLWHLLSLTQEGNFKAGRFALISADELIVAHTNETEYRSF